MMKDFKTDFNYLRAYKSIKSKFDKNLKTEIVLIRIWLQNFKKIKTEFKS